MTPHELASLQTFFLHARLAIAPTSIRCGGRAGERRGFAGSGDDRRRADVPVTASDAIGLGGMPLATRVAEWRGGTTAKQTLLFARRGLWDSAAMDLTSHASVSASDPTREPDAAEDSPVARC
jgi:hypothetical protein